MTIIGNFLKHEDKIIGTVLTLKLHVEVTFVPISKTGAKSPDYRAYAHGVEIGAAWDNTEEGFLSVVLDDPSFAAPIRCRLNSVSANGYQMVWNR